MTVLHLEYIDDGGERDDDTCLDQKIRVTPLLEEQGDTANCHLKEQRDFEGGQLVDRPRSYDVEGRRRISD